MNNSCPTKKIIFHNEDKKTQFEEKLSNNLEIILSEGITSTNGITNKVSLLENGDVLVKTFVDSGHITSLDILLSKDEFYLENTNHMDMLVA